MALKPPTEVSVPLNLSEDDVLILCEAFAIDATKPDLDRHLRDALKGFAEAAVQEHLDHLLGVEDLAGKIDLRQRRLLRLVDKVFVGRMPSAAVVGSLFHIPERATNTLIATTAARFRQLDKPRRKAVSAALHLLVEKKAHDPPKSNGEYYLVSRDAAVVSYTRDLLAASPENLSALGREQSLAATYVLHDASLEYLCEALGEDVAVIRAEARERK